MNWKNVCYVCDVLEACVNFLFTISLRTELVSPPSPSFTYKGQQYICEIILFVDIRTSKWDKSSLDCPTWALWYCTISHETQKKTSLTFSSTIFSVFVTSSCVVFFSNKFLSRTVYFPRKNKFKFFRLFLFCVYPRNKYIYIFPLLFRSLDELDIGQSYLYSVLSFSLSQWTKFRLSNCRKIVSRRWTSYHTTTIDRDLLMNEHHIYFIESLSAAHHVVRTLNFPIITEILRDLGSECEKKGAHSAVYFAALTNRGRESNERERASRKK